MLLRWNFLEPSKTSLQIKANIKQPEKLWCPLQYKKQTLNNRRNYDAHSIIRSKQTTGEIMMPTPI
jgi:hypothetical protein